MTHDPMDHSLRHLGSAPVDAKRTSDSYTEQIQLISPAVMNGYGRLFGGQLMAWIDVVAGIVARRHSGCNVTTAAVDNLQFLGPAFINDSILLVGKVTHVGTTSMEVRIQTYVEPLKGKRILINTAYLVMVALDENEKPVKVPPLILETLEERLEWEAGKKRRALRKQRQTEHF